MIKNNNASVTSDLQSPLLKDPPGLLELGQAHRWATALPTNFRVKTVDPFRDRAPKFQQGAVVDVLIEAGYSRQGQFHCLFLTY